MNGDRRPEATFGIGLRPGHYEMLLEAPRDDLDWLEIISENFMAVGGQPRQYLRQFRQRYPVAMHGVGLNIAGLGPLDDDYLKHMRTLMREVEPFLVTDHLCWTAKGGAHSYDLLPFPLTRRMLQHVAGRLHAVQEFLGTALLLENPSYYARYRETEMSEAEFLAALCQMTGCGILLDLNNLYVNECNLGLSASAYLETLPTGAVRQFHVAGHATYPDIRIDTHDHQACAEVWQLYRQAVRRWPTAATLYEWDDALPPLADMMAEVAKARCMWQAAWDDDAIDPAARAVPLPLTVAASSRVGTAVVDRQPAMEALWDILTHPRFPHETLVLAQHFREDLPIDYARGLQVYQQGYFLRLCDACRSIFPTLAYVTGEHGFQVLLAAYFSGVYEQTFSLNLVGERLAAFLLETPLGFNYGVGQDVLAALARFDWQVNDLFLTADDGGERLAAADMLVMDEQGWQSLAWRLSRDARLHASPYDVAAVWHAQQAKEVPERPTSQPTFYALLRREGHVEPVALEDSFYQALVAFDAGLSMAEVVQGTVAADEVETWLGRFVPFLIGWAEQGFLTRRDARDACKAQIDAMAAPR